MDQPQIYMCTCVLAFSLAGKVGRDFGEEDA